jgi:hypothetical protein
MSRQVRVVNAASGGEAYVPESSLGTWARAGWVREDKAPEPPKAAAGKASDDNPPDEADGSKGKDK